MNIALIYCMKRGLMKSRGFTLIELIIVVVVIGILAAIAIPNYYSLVDKAKIASVVANMHTAQVTVETEAMGSNQTYFPNIASFVNVLPVNFINPYDQGNVSIQNEVDINIEGVVEYKGDASYYTITGYGKDLINTIFLLNPSKVTAKNSRPEIKTTPKAVCQSILPEATR